MDFSKISDFQLYEIIQNESLGKEVRKLANEEFTNRKIGIDDLQALIAKHDSIFEPPKIVGLSIYFKLGLIICPFFIEIYNLIAGRSLAKGNKKKWKDYLVFVCLGYLFWTFLILLFARFCMRH